MQITVHTGDTGAGKTTSTFKDAYDLLWRDKKYFKRSGILRKTASNLKFSDWVEDEFGVSGIHENGQIVYWEESQTLIPLRDHNIIWDEIANELEADEWQMMGRPMKRWLRQHRKFGNEIVANTQDFDQVAKSFRRLVHTLYWHEKLIGSPDLSATRPAVKHPWGLTIQWTIPPKNWDPEKITALKTFSGFRFINKTLISGFDTRQEIKGGEYPSLRHVTRSCENSDCSFCKTVHI